MTTWSKGRRYGRPREPRTAARTGADDVTTDRLPTQPPPEAAGPRPRTAPLQVVHGQGGGRGPDRWTLRAGELLDQYLQRIITRHDLTHRLAGQVWASTWHPDLLRAAVHQLDVVLTQHLPALRERAAWYARVEADVDRCAQCAPHQTCPMHLQQLRTYWNDLHAVAARLAHPPRPAHPNP